MKRKIVAMLLVMAVSVFMLVPEGEVHFIKADTEAEGQAVTNGAVTQPEQIESEEDMQNVVAPVILGDETKHEMKFTKRPVEKNAKEASYLVVTKNTEGKKKLLNQYKERKASKHSGYAKEEGILTLEMNGTEASELQKRSDVLYIEKDICFGMCR